MQERTMERFWNARAREDALFFVDDRRHYRNSDPGSFWRDGERDLDGVLTALGVEIEPESVVLDIGCGVGRLTRVLAARATQVLAIDISPEMLARARELNPHLTNVRWLRGDGIGLGPVPDGAVDVCVSHVVFQHLPDPRITLGYVEEMGRVLRPGGFAAFGISNDPTVHHARHVGLAARLAVALGRRPRGQTDPSWCGSAVELDDLRRHSGRAGLHLDRIVGEGTQYCMVLARRSAA